jgi:hypothetical protein
MSHFFKWSRRAGDLVSWIRTYSCNNPADNQVGFRYAGSISNRDCHPRNRIPCAPAVIQWMRRRRQIEVIGMGGLSSANPSIADLIFKDTAGVLRDRRASSVRVPLGRTSGIALPSVVAFKFPADAIFAANVEAERKRPSGPSIAISFRGPHRNFSTSTLPGAAECRIVGLQRCSANYFPFVIRAYHTLPCVAIHSQ